jgi:hypothetical protein
MSGNVEKRGVCTNLNVPSGKTLRNDICEVFPQSRLTFEASALLEVTAFWWFDRRFDT